MEEGMGSDLLDGQLRLLIAAGGSDLHVKAGVPPRFRINGALVVANGAPVLRPEDTEAMAAAVMPDHVAEHFRQAHQADFAYVLDRNSRFRVNVYRQRHTVALVFRRVGTTLGTVAELNLPPVVERLADEPRGLVLVTGPTGSGKSTTLAAMLEHINQTRAVNIITLEDPIEFVHDDRMASVSQREMGVDFIDFTSGLRAALRQDPDVIFVGEMRDAETVDTALRAAATGHLVLSALHTESATETANRIVDFFPRQQTTQIRAVLAGALRGTVCQRLVVRADGHGRVPVVETMVVNGRIQQCLLDPVLTERIEEILAEGEYYGMQTFDQHLAKLLESGTIDLPTALVAATNPHDLQVHLLRSGLVT
jgi:twitching motility protein PilT